MNETTLLEQLTDDIGMARELLELIDQEFKALSDRNLTELEALLTKKQPLLALLGQHGALRSQWLIDQQLSADRAGLENAVSKYQEGASILETAQLLEAELENCRGANERNGRLIRANQGALGSMLSILQGKDDTPSLYDNRGGASKSKQQRPLSQA
ncbi:flagella synthesis protein FlgN [Stutzerimonas stutzeri]|jgi:flagella synthesis protein FlgN|uniref:Flagellar biosynthesis/type III secretory pathway chaperone n=1 Tax=Stutzerimonas stutzeri RCH2 TaxID=644801 RepID=L0GNC9_STUST|nr:flagellar protein FlgN [Stutzerimonas stutzeri]AGA87476.1 flagellar biosynthesis/type III secretory pathway chaperone [Stutzerimonas stutzeri RCH2]OCX90587.1 MAG: flagellar biosynthesis protein FlgN [Pseudomonas sp. CO183]